MLGTAFLFLPLRLPSNTGGNPVPKSLKELSHERADLFAKNRDLLAKADADSRRLSAEESAEYDKRDTDIEKLGDEIKLATDDENRRQRLASLTGEMSRPLPRQTAVSGAPQPGTDGAQLTNLSIDFGRGGTCRLSSRDEMYSALATRASNEYSDTFCQYLRGEKRDYESLGLQVAVDPKGGYLVPTDFLTTLIKFVDDMVTMRKLGTVLPPTLAKSVGMLSFDTDYADADWTAEVTASDLSEDDAARYGKREMTPHMLTKLIKASKKLVRSSPGITNFIAQRAAYKIALTENKKFLSGSGSQQPLGPFTASADGVTTARDVSCAGPATTTFVMDDLINLKYSLKYQYQAKSTWLVHRDFMKALRKLKYGTGEYMLGINGQPDTLLDRPVVVDENAPNTFTTGLYVALLADFSFYWIQDTPNWEVETLNELFTLKNQMGWLFRKETDGMPVLAEAFARLKLA